MTNKRIFLRDLVCIVIVAAMMLSIAFAYKRPFIFHDSGTYYVYGEHIQSEWDSFKSGGSVTVKPIESFDQSYFGARSPSYSYLFYKLTYDHRLLAVAVAQALVVALALFLFCAAVAPARRTRCFLVTAAVLALGSTLPYFVAFMMPDIFGGVVALCLVALFAFSRELGRWQVIVLCALLALSASFHPTFLYPSVVALMLGLVVAWRCGVKVPTRAGIAIIVVALVAGFAFPPVYRAIERSKFDHAIDAPPFIMARLLEDGTGAAFLRYKCPRQPNYVPCQVPLRQPVNSDTFLWASAAEGGSYRAVDAAYRSAMRDAEVRFAIDVVLHSPWAQVKASASNLAFQLAMVDVEEPLFDPATQSSFRLFNIIGARPGVLREFWAEPLLTVLRYAVLAISFVTLLYIAAWTRRRPADEHAQRIMLAIVLVIGYVGANAAICGIVSKPWPRYNARIIWIIPALAIALCFVPSIANQLRRVIADCGRRLRRRGRNLQP